MAPETTESMHVDVKFAKMLMLVATITINGEEDDDEENDGADDGDYEYDSVGPRTHVFC